MEADKLLNILDYWSFWDGQIPDSIDRDVSLPSELGNNSVLIVQGVRRAGKSTLLSKLPTHYSLNCKDCAFVNFEDPQLTQELEYGILDKIVTVFREHRAHQRGLYFFLDEIQNVEGWQKWIRKCLERPGNNYFILSGSNASMLSGDLASVLTGRHRTIQLFPFSFHEFLRVKLKANVEDYLFDGGFPEPLQTKEGEDLLRQYFFDIIERDVRESLGARSSLSIRQVVQMVYESAGSEMSLRRIAGATGLATDTVSSYLEACESAYLLFSCPYFAFSAKKRANRNRKYYPIDTGLRRVVISKSGKDHGKQLEIAVFLELKKRFGEVYYWKGNGEVDFVINSKEGIFPVQVTWGEAQERHQNALEEFFENFPMAEEAIHVNAENFGSQWLP